MAKRRKGRPLDGVFLLDKPQGMTSNQALQRVRRIFGAQKAGHTGSLDPLATGVLPICFGEATKFSRYLLDADKGYYTTATLGVTRTTGDSDGEIVHERPVPEINADELSHFLSRFKGDIQQVPSMYSALKFQGKPLYEYARKGITIDRPARPVTIFRLDIDDIRSDEIDLSVECSKGTYIRSLVEDIGNELGCGAHVSMLRRFKAGHYDLSESTSLDDLMKVAGVGTEKTDVCQDFSKIDQFVLPTDSLLPKIPRVCIKSELINSILHGQAVRISAGENSGFVGIYAPMAQLEATIAERQSTGEQAGLSAGLQASYSDDQFEYVFMGVAELDSEGNLKPKRLIAF